jgi:hypothetical protein
MPKRRIKRKRGEGIAISGPATVHVSRRVTLVIDAPREARIARLTKKTAAAVRRAED